MKMLETIESCTRNDQAADLAAVDHAMEIVYRFLAMAFSDPRGDAADPTWRASDRQILESALSVLRDYSADQHGSLGFGELPAERLVVSERCLDQLSDRAVRCQEYTRVFCLIPCRECPPYETEYLINEDTFFRSQQMADLTGFYQAFGLTLAPSRRERPDHVAIQLEFVGLLLRLGRMALVEILPADMDRYTVCHQARRSFVQDHLLSWIPAFSLALRHRAGEGCFYELAELLAALSPLERQRLDLDPPQMPLPLIVRDAAPAESCAGCLVT